MQLEAQGYCWESIQNWRVMRNFDGENVPDDFSAEKMPSWDELTQMTRDQITDVQRESFSFFIRGSYCNVWDWSETGVWRVDRNAQRIIRFVNACAELIRRKQHAKQHII